MATFPQITSPPQASAEVVVNEALETMEHQAVYGKNQSTTTGLTWGYYGGRWGGFAVTASTFSLTNTSANYIVVARATGVTTASTSATNWNDAANYARVYKLTTAGGVVTAEEDHRAGPGGISGASATAASGTVTHTAGALTASALMVGNGTDDAKVLASLGTTTTLLHGNAAGLPTFAAVSLTADVSGALPVANGGTASTSESAARTALGVAIGSDVQAFDADLSTLAGLTATTDSFIQAKSSAWAARTVAQVAADLQGAGTTTALVGYRGVPSSTHSAAYTTVAADAGTCLEHPAADANARTFTIDSVANVGWDAGTAISFKNETSQVLSIAVTTQTLTLAGTTTSGTRSLAQNGIATAHLNAAKTVWLISGTGLT